MLFRSTNILIVQISNTSSSTRTGGIPTWNSYFMNEADYGASYKTEIWYLTHPTTGTLTLNIPNSSSCYLYVTLSSYSSTGAIRNIFYNTNSLASSTSISVGISAQANADNLSIHTSTLKSGSGTLSSIIYRDRKSVV